MPEVISWQSPSPGGLQTYDTLMGVEVRSETTTSPLPKTMPQPDVNSWLEEELYQQFRHDQQTVDESWKQVFRNVSAAQAAERAPGDGAPVGTPVSSTVSSNGSAAIQANGAAPLPVGNGTPAPVAAAAPPTAPAKPAVAVAPYQQLTPLKGAPGRLAKNMAASLTVPTATSMREVPVKVLEENRRLINQFRASSAKSKVSFTHVLAYAIVHALKDLPS
jgi:multifunctional 2-oxoglutarate metabolism enzyme